MERISITITNELMNDFIAMKVRMFMEDRKQPSYSEVLARIMKENRLMKQEIIELKRQLFDENKFQHELLLEHARSPRVTMGQQVTAAAIAPVKIEHLAPPPPPPSQITLSLEKKKRESHPPPLTTALGIAQELKELGLKPIDDTGRIFPSQLLPPKEKKDGERTTD